MGDLVGVLVLVGVSLGVAEGGGVGGPIDGTKGGGVGVSTTIWITRFAPIPPPATSEYVVVSFGQTWDWSESFTGLPLSSTRLAP